MTVTTLIVVFSITVDVSLGTVMEPDSQMTGRRGSITMPSLELQWPTCGERDGDLDAVAANNFNTIMISKCNN